MQLQLTVPPGASAGQELLFMTPTGQQMAVQIPLGCPPGSTFVFVVPDAAPTAIPMGITLDEPAPARRLPAPQKFSECPISFNPLHTAPLGAFLDGNGRRVSNHYFNLEAANQWLASGNGTCPLTRQPIHSVLAIPNVISSPDEWFRAVDIDRNGKLSRAETIEAIKAQFPVDVAALDAAIVDPNHFLWEQWDVNRDGTLTRDELLAPNGLISTVREMFVPAHGSQAIGTDPPRITDRARWFDYWDSPATGGDGNGTLNREEVIRALLKTTGTTGNANAVMQMRQTVGAIWGVFDTDGSGEVDRTEFLQRDGLADTILATFNFG